MSKKKKQVEQRQRKGISDGEVLEAMKKLGGGGITSTQLRDHFGLGYRTTIRHRMEGLAKRKKIVITEVRRAGKKQFRYHLPEHVKVEPEGLEEKEILEEEYLQEEATISLESDLESFLLVKLNVLEEGLRVYQGETGRQFQVESGRIDVLAQDKDNNFVVLELKAGTASEAVLAQILAYMADVTRELSKGNSVRGIVVAYGFAERLVAASSLLPTIKLMKYKVNFEFEEVTKQ